MPADKDIVERLRDWIADADLDCGNLRYEWGKIVAQCHEAASEIERLRGEKVPDVEVTAFACLTRDFCEKQHGRLAGKECGLPQCCTARFILSLAATVNIEQAKHAAHVAALRDKNTPEAT